MLQNIIANKRNQWLNSPECTVKYLIDYIHKTAVLRDTQIEAIEQYLFLKIKGENKPLWQLFSEGFFINGSEDLSREHISQASRVYLENNITALALFNFSKIKQNGTALLPELENLIKEKADLLDYNKIIKSIFYNVNYTDYLFSLPMGAGKTYLMAAFIYLDLYFAQLEPENKNFAHNFLVLVPSGLKSSIVPSLKTIENFNPSWVLPEPAASELKKILKFELLNQQKSGKKSNRARNPNAEKVNKCLPNPFGQVFVVNAEKVILDRLQLSEQKELIEKTEDEKDRYANELRNLIGKIPNLQILIDEVHHATDSDIELRQVVNRWNNLGNVTTTLGFSGTPYLESAEKIQIDDDVVLKFNQITNTIYYYSLIQGIGNFLKKPKIKTSSDNRPLNIIKEGVKEFYEQYGNKVYSNGTVAKLAIYCGLINRLEEEVFPFLTGEMRINPEEILRYHKGNKKHKVSNEAELEYLTLDKDISKKKIILLAQIGKEGWDCRSLTGVILAQQGDCPKNMVLQTSCRCLREVHSAKDETALIYLNEFNEKKLDKQLKDEQRTSIEEINKAGKSFGIRDIPRISRMDYLKLPDINYYQLSIKYNELIIEDTPNTKEKLENISSNNSILNTLIITERGLNPNDPVTRTILQKHGNEKAVYDFWIYDICKESFGSCSLGQLSSHEKLLKNIFSIITYSANGETFFNELYNQEEVKALIRKAFHCKRDVKTEEEIFEDTASLLLVSKLNSVPEHPNLYPDKDSVKQVIDLDASKQNPKTALQNIKDTLRNQGLGTIADSYSFSDAVFHKDKTLHYLPYNFSQSKFEKDFLKDILKLDIFQNSNLEIYYNGERHLTSFYIHCYAEHSTGWKPVGIYTPDFLIIQRQKDSIYKALIVETKGKGFAEQTQFLLRKKFMEGEFLRLNNEKFNYRKFDFAYISDDISWDTNQTYIQNKIINFFKE
jgi:hypothetical protein